MKQNKFSLLLLISVSTVILFSCSSPKPRTKWTDKNMRVMIDPDSIDEENYIQIQRSLVASGKFTVVDRARGMNALKKEQERTHREESDRYEDKEKWSHWGKMYGVGAIVVPHVQCTKKNSFMNRTKLYLHCRQFLSMVDSNTGEVFVAVEGKNEGPASYDLGYMKPDWEETMDKMITAYPKYFSEKGYEKEVVVYQELSEEHAKRQKEEKQNRSTASKQGQE